MKFIKSFILPVLLATIWISLNEFLRNEILFKSYWIDHYDSMGLQFPSETINNLMWGVWSFVFAIIIYFVVRRYCPGKAFLITWSAGFLLMWLVAGNMGFLPFGLLKIAIPWSIVEVFGACLMIYFILRKINPDLLKDKVGEKE